MSIDPSAPLRGVVICCTSIPDEKRTFIASYAEQMGALHQLDLTRDVTHLIVGSSETMKYKYVARNRQDILPMTESWIEAIRDLWIADEDIDLEALERKYMLPTFHSLRFSMTGCEEPAERLRIAELVKANGATYEGDLTRSITHLISLRTDGAKYKAAKSWGLNIVSIEWLYQSLERGMILEEKLFDPSLPKEERGKGAWDRTLPLKTSLGKRSNANNVAVENGKRKLRRTASMKLCNQHDKIWADIYGGNSIGQGYGNVVGETKEVEKSGQSDKIKTPVLRSEKIAPARKMGLFFGCKFWLYNFPSTKMEILQNHLVSNDGEVLYQIRDLLVPLDKLPEELLSSRLFLVVPHDLPKKEIPVLSKSSPVEIVTVWWIERCLHHKRFYEPREHVIGRPFPVFPIPDIVTKMMTLCSSSFTGIDLLHLTRAVGLIGATYSDFMTPKASLLITKSADAVRKDKMSYALEWKIPVVTENWLWDSIEAGKSLPIHEYKFKPVIASVPLPTIKESFTPPADLKQNNSSNNIVDHSRKASGHLTSNSSVQSHFQAILDETKTPPGENQIKEEQQATSVLSQLQEEPSTALRPIEIENVQDSARQTHRIVSTTSSSQKSHPHPSEDITNAISSLLAMTRSTTNNQTLDRTETRKRQRILGRVTSNNSNQSRATSVDSTATHGHPVQWISNSSDQTANERIEMLINGDRTLTNIDENNLPSTQLQYEDPDSTVARELIMARMRGEVVDIEKLKILNKKETVGIFDGTDLKVPRSRKRHKGSNIR
ncbi:S-M checkpoint control protein rad4 [Golovinomyces cichoracearum]|uniref:S-M checkpoint control protein rad4 n=1 Tax=Golovinomyces cichoracearum TaxID=62708 RepID=A0A420IZ42_9PEZI|nr:S-M checkpoint control protein rad4 [Golovinomyces cichoracearum]